MFGKLYKLLVKEKPRISRTRSLGGVPVVPPGVTGKRGPDGQHLVYVPRRAPFGKWLGRLTDGKVPPAKVVLDDLGGAVWRSIDGKRTVEEIVERFAGRFKLHRREAEASVVEFINMLMQRGMVQVMLPAGEDQP